MDSPKMESQEINTHTDVNIEENNGEMGSENYSNTNTNFQNEPIGSPSLSVNSNGSISKSNLEVISTPNKGYGLKKWRRIRRDSSKDTTAGFDFSSVIMKKRVSVNEQLSNRDNNNFKESSNDKENNTVEVELENPAFPIGSLDLELEQLAASIGFSIGIDLGNSDDPSSQASTNASAFKPKHEIGFGRERGKLKNAGGRGIGNAMQQSSQRGRGHGVDSSKKIRGDRVRVVGKENSQSSVESDLQSSNLSHMKCGNGVSNGKLSDKSLNFDGDESYISEEVRSGYYKENGVHEDLLRGEPDLHIKEEENMVKRENFETNSSFDFYAEPIAMLQAAQEALETEIQKFGEIGKETESNNFDNLSLEREASSFSTLEAHLLESNRNIELLQCKLEEALATIKAREIKVLELEDIINNEASICEDVHNLEFELEFLMKKKIEAEIEFLVVTRTTQNWKILVEDQIAVLQEQKSLADDQANIVLKMREAEIKAINLKEQAQELESHCNELLETEKVLKLQNKVCKFSTSFFIQLLLLGVAFGLFLIQRTPPSVEVVPT